MIFGAVLMASGAFAVWVAYALVTTTGPEGKGPVGWKETLFKLTTDGAGPCGFGLLLIGVGAWFAFGGGSKPAGRTP